MQDTRAHLLELQKLTSDASIEKKGELLKRISDLFFLTTTEQSGDAPHSGKIATSDRRGSGGDCQLQRQDHLLAISGRDSLYPPVTDIIVERGDTRAASRVAAKHGAKFSDTGFQKLTKRAAEEDDVLSALTSRRHSPILGRRD